LTATALAADLLRELAHASAEGEELAHGWAPGNRPGLETGERYARIARADGLAFYVRVEAGRVCLSCGIPGPHRYGRPSVPTITVAADRRPDIIGREALRRFLPGLLVAWAFELTARAADASAAEARDRTAEALRRAGFEVRARRNGSAPDPDAPLDVHGWPSTTVQAGGSVRVEAFSIPADRDPAAVLAFLRDAIADRPEPTEAS
jgi:hypothetical protein